MDFIRIIKDKKPKFFVAENVEGLLRNNNKAALLHILSQFDYAGYKVVYKLFNASEYNIPQDRKRVFFIGIRKNIKHAFLFDTQEDKGKTTLRDVIYDLKDTSVSSNGWNSNPNVVINAHEYLSDTTSDYSSQYMSRNRVKSWDEFSYTITASARQITQHPSAPKMKRINPDLFEFDGEHNYRRLSVRECARIQTFPDIFELKYTKINNGYKMIGNAVPVKLAEVIAKNINKFFNNIILNNN